MLLVLFEATAAVLLVELPVALVEVEPVAWPAVLFWSFEAKPVAELVVDGVALVLSLALEVADEVSLLATAPLVEAVELVSLLATAPVDDVVELVALPLRSLVEEVEAVSLLASAPLEDVLEVADGEALEVDVAAFCEDMSLLATAPVELVLFVAAVLSVLPLVAPEVAAAFCEDVSLLAKPLVEPVVEEVSALVDGDVLDVPFAI